ncbi:MAG: DUF4139 domain-containing protein [Myxococcales bacterium]|nr:DUF4139 domain-containing protein [Myxococcales bacterium]
MKKLRLGSQALLGALVLAALTPGALAQTKKVSTAEQRKEVSITVYNQNFGLVREIRELDVGTGTVALEFRDVSANIQPETVSVKSLSGGDSLSVLEQNYRYDLLTPQKLLEKHVGKKVRVWRWNEKLGKDEAFDAEVLSVAGGQTVMKIGGEITYNFPGRIAFPSVPDNLMSKPTLVWKLDSKLAKQKIEATYLTQNLNWKSDYVFVINDADTAGDLTGWVTLVNQSGATYKNAKLKLVAGDVQRVSGRMAAGYGRKAMSAKDVSKEERFKEEGFFEYHLYTLQQPTDVLENEQKQVTLLEAKNAKVKKKLIYFGQQYWYRGKYGEVQKNQKVGVYLDVENSKQNGLGMPLPKGTVRVYKADKSGAKQFIGEDSIDHTPRDEKIRIKMGEAFDVVGDRKQMEWRTLGGCTSESTWEIELRNHKDKASQVEIYEPIGGDWTIIESTHKHDKKDAFTFSFDVNVPANGKTKIRYKVRVKWC